MIAITGCCTECNGSINRTPGQAGINRTRPPGFHGWIPSIATAMKKDVSNRHAGKLNTAFCDGHVESIKVDGLYHDKSDQSLRRWNYDNEPHREQISVGAAQ